MSRVACWFCLPRSSASLDFMTCEPCNWFILRCEETKHLFHVWNFQYISRYWKIFRKCFKCHLGCPRDSYKFKLCSVNPMLERKMEYLYTAILQRMTPKLSKIHLWLVVCKLDFCLGVFDILIHDVLGLTNYGIYKTENKSSYVISF